MRMAYERPVMQAELYMTNSYCAVCKDRPYLLGHLLTNEESHWFSPNGGINDTIDAETLTNMGFSLNHEFNQSLAIEMTRPNNVWGGGQTQYYWVCTCDACEASGDRYYLEYSAEWANEYEGQNVYVLYKENSGDQDLDIDWGNGGNLPDDGNYFGQKVDYGIAAVVADVAVAYS